MEARKITLSSGNVYAVTPLNPHEGISWSNRVMAALGPVLSSLFSGGKAESGLNSFSLDDKAATQLMHDAIAQCWTPKNEKLSDPAAFNAWFLEHPGDLYELGVRACVEVAREFFPGPLRIMLESFMALGQEAD